MRRRPRLPLLLVLVGLLAAACTGTGDPESTPTTLQRGGKVVVAIDQEPSRWNPNKPSDYALGTLTQHVLPRAFRVMPNFEVVLDSDLLESARQTNDDPQTIVYVIRDEAVWSDGTAITGDDFRYVWNQITDPANDAASTAGYEDIASVDSSDERKTVTVVFERRYRDWQGLFNHLLPAHLMGGLEGGWDGLEGENIPTFSGGPFLLRDYEPAQSVRLVANRDYWGRNKAALDEIVIRFGIDASDIPAALENDEIDVAYPQPEPAVVEQVAKLAPGVTHRVTTGLTFEHLDFDLENEFLQDRAVRQAIAFALDEQQLAERTVGALTEGGASPLYNRIFAEGQPGYEAHGDAYRGVDVDAAVEVLEAAGYQRDDDGIFSKDGRRLTVRLTTTGGNALREATQRVIKTQLKAAGIEATPDNEPGTAVFKRLFPDDPNARDFDAALFSWVRPPFASGNEPLYATGSLANAMRYSNPDVDDLFAKASRQLDDDDAAATYNQIDKILWHDLPTIPLYASPSLLAFRSSVVNVRDNVTTAGPLWNAYEWARRDA